MDQYLLVQFLPFPLALRDHHHLVKTGPDPLPSRHEVEAPIQTTHSVAGEMAAAVAVATTVLA